MTSDKPWSLRQFQHHMRQAGWQRIPGPGSGWKHVRTKKQIELQNWNSKHNRPEWEVWALAKQTPPPF